MGKIQTVRFSLQEFDYVKPFHITGSIASSATNILVEIILDNGIIGLGEAAPSFRVNGERPHALVTLQDSIQQMLLDLDVKNYRQIFDRMDSFSRSAPSIKAAVQYAALDALSQESGTAVYQILGGAKECVETDMTVGIDTLENSVADAKAIFDKGFRHIKIKVGENIDSDIGRMLAIADATQGASYVVDANMGYTPKEGAHFAQVMYDNQVEIDIFEQPVKADDFDGLRLVREKSPYPVGADESVKTKYDALRLIREGCVDYINIKLMKSGISDALAIVEIAKTAGIGLMIGCMSESPVGITQSIHFAAGTGAFTHHDLDSFLLLKSTSGQGKFRLVKTLLYPVSS